MWQGINSRKFPRVECPCTVIVSHSEHGISFRSKTENIGVGGICVPLSAPLERFSRVFLEIFLKDTSSLVRCAGKIVWVIRKSSALQPAPSSFDTGIEFTGLAEDDRNNIEKVVSLHI